MRRGVPMGGQRRRVSRLASFLLCLALASSTPAHAADPHQASTSTPTEPPWASDLDRHRSATGTGEVAGRPYGEAIDPFEWDPNYLIGGEWVQTYTLGTDTIEVWLCEPGGVPVGVGMAEAIASLEYWVGGYFAEVSGGRYNIEFIPGGTVVVSGDGYVCQEAVESLAAAHPAVSEGALVLVSTGVFGAANPDRACEGDSCFFPMNRRLALVAPDTVVNGPAGHPYFAIGVHEMGHLLMWPHSYTGVTDSEYDNPIEIMSSNALPGGQRLRYPLLTLAVNRYAAGWIEPDQVRVLEPGDGASFEIVSIGHAGTQMAALTFGAGVFASLEARLAGSLDPIPPEYEGVAIHYVVQIPEACPAGAAYGWCFGIDRVHLTGTQDPHGFSHVLHPGESLEIGGEYLVEVVARTEDGFDVVVGDLPRFVDVGRTHIFYNAIEWLASAGITRGCNPPTNDRYCPDGFVTRGQMAAFLVRALGLSEAGDMEFVDDDESIFESDIEKLAAAGITRGCNPPINDRFCPDRVVTRGEMAAFLVRALGLSVAGDMEFVDDNESVFESDIEKLAAAGITRGCNPPVNDRFCPDQGVTRGQMAAFLQRALG